MWLLTQLLLVASVTANIGVITFDTPGNYQLNPQDYHYSPQIIVEMWGAGGGGCSGDCGIGGGSGAYIKATINTNLETFNLTIGLGGKGGSACEVRTSNYYNLPWYTGTNDERYKYLNGFNGTDTIITSDIHNLIAGGGRNGNFSTIIYVNRNRVIDKFNGGFYQSNIETTISLNGYSGSTGSNKFFGCYQGYQVNPVIAAGNGANSPYGMTGGLGNNYTLYNSCDYCNLATNGSNPGSGGGGSYYNYHQVVNGNCPNVYGTFIFPAAGDGGNGTIIVYYQYEIISNSSEISVSPSRSYIRSNTVSDSNSSTKTPSVTLSATKSTSIEQINLVPILLIIIAAITMSILIVMLLICIICLTKNNVYVQSIQVQN